MFNPPQEWGFIPMRYFIGFMITIGLLILLIILLIRGGGNSNAPVTTKALASYSSTNAEVSFLNSGPINAESLHREILISVDRDSVTFKILAGYNGRVISSKRFNNTQNSYNAFLSALGLSGYTLGANKDTQLSETGRCPLNSRYVFELNQGSEQIQRTWATACGGLSTFKGNVSLTIQLFQAQVPDYNSLVQNVQF